jgi:hypothetical protein
MSSEEYPLDSVVVCRFASHPCVVVGVMDGARVVEWPNGVATREMVDDLQPFEPPAVSDDDLVRILEGLRRF